MGHSRVFIAIWAGLIHLAGCDGVGTVCQTSGSADVCGNDTICTFVRNPDDLPAVNVCLQRCESSTDCGEGELCRFVYCSDQSSCQTGVLADPPTNLCMTGAGGSGGAGGGAGGSGGVSGAGGMSGTGGTGGPSGCDSTASAFVKTLDPDMDFSESAIDTEDTTNLPTTWGSFTIFIEITAELEGHLLQYGFQNTASNFEDSGVFYDNVVVDPGPEYTQNFESLDINGTEVGDGWVFFANVFDSSGVRKFGYNNPPNPAPNNTGFISGIAAGEGGAEQGDQQLSVFSDYNCCQGTNEGHFNGTDLVEINVFRERAVEPADVGKTITLSFDAKRGNINEGCPAP